MKTTTWIAVAATIVLWATVAFAATCQDLLDNNAYECSFVNEALLTSTGCFRFTSPGAIGEFDIHIRALVQFFDGGCSCRAQGNFDNPSFDAARTFDCFAAPGGLIVGGKAGGSKITGHITRPNGSSTLFVCNKPGTGLGGGTPCP